MFWLASKIQPNIFKVKVKVCHQGFWLVSGLIFSRNRKTASIFMIEIDNLLSQFQVSWLRHDDTHLLTIGRLTYTSDLRFKAIHKLYSEDWLLRIKPTTHRDGGRYECQISTTPPTSHIITLTIAGKPFPRPKFSIEKKYFANRNVFFQSLVLL